MSEPGMNQNKERVSTSSFTIGPGRVTQVALIAPPEVGVATVAEK